MNKKILVIGIIGLILSIGLYLKEDNKSKIMINNEKEKTKETLAVYVQDSSGNYVEQQRLPGSDYVINESKSYCYTKKSSEHDTSIRMYTENGKHIISNLGKDNKCHLWFDPKPMTIPEVLAKYTKDNSRSGEITANFTENTPTTVYSKADESGTSYVFAGENPNNWVKLGNLYFRIIRFNGDGTMRLIYSGEGSTATSGTGTQIGEKAFNSTYNDNMYVGLQYTSEQVHGTGTNSTILGTAESTDATTLYGWYNSKLKEKYASLIDTNAGFCSDRDNYTNNTGTTAGGGTGTTTTYYGGYIRYVKGGSWQTSYTPVLTCKNASDNLKLPVGLITADEYALAGGGVRNNGDSYYNTTFWLHTGQSYWTMSPYSFGGTRAWVLCVDSYGFLGEIRVEWSGGGVRPVINLKTSTLFSSGNGTAENPYGVKV